MKKILFLLLISHTLFSATPQEIESYLSISKKDREIIQIEQVFDSMRASEDNSTQEINQIYSLYLEEHLSSDELQTILVLYRTPIMQRYVIETDTGELPAQEMKEFLQTLKETPLTTERLDIVENILKHTLDEKQMLAFYNSMTQRYQLSKNKDTNRTKKELAFVEMMKSDAKNRLLYGTQVLEIEEMRELDNALQSSIISKVSKVQSDAMIYVMDTFIKNIVAKPLKNNEQNSSN